MSYILDLSLLLVFGKSLEWLFEKREIHPIIAHVLTGVILGPFVLGMVVPGEELKVLSEFGLIMMMLYTGLTSNFSAISTNKFKATVVAFLGVVFSFVFGYAAVTFFHYGTATAIFVGVVLGNTAIEVTSGVIMRERVDRNVSSILMGAAFADDIMAVYLIGVITALSRGALSPLDMLILTVRIVVFIIAVLLFSELVFKRSRRVKFLIRDINTFFTFTLVLTFLLALLAEEAGLNRIIGAYLAGLTISRLRERKDPLVISRIKLNELIGELQVVLTEFFIPLFFIYVGLVFNPPVSEISLVLIAALYIAAVLGKLLGCSLGMKLFRFDWNRSLMVGIGMGGRGSLELAILKFGLDTGLINQLVFASIVIVSMLTALTTPQFFKLYLRRVKRKA